MKLKVFLLLTAELLLPLIAQACGPFNPIIPTPPYFVINHGEPPTDFDRIENLKLWQAQTSEQIPVADIEQVVYRDDSDTFDKMSNQYNKEPSQNLMYTYLYNTNNEEAISFLSLAKGIEETRRDDERRSPWYYPEHRYGICSNADLESYISRAMSYDGKIFKERYAMQTCRALFASNQYARCIEYYDSVFSDIDNSSLMKRMAGNYVGGSWIHLGDTVKANILFARAADLNSLRVENPLEYMLEHNPNAPQIMDYIRRHVANDSSTMADYVPLAKKALNKKEVTHKGDWAFFLAYFYNNYNKNPKTAKKYLNQALKLKFSSDELKDQAIAYKMIVDAGRLTPESMLANLQWFEKRCNSVNDGARDWNRRCRNIIYTQWIPTLWSQGDYATAILLADYAASKEIMNYDYIHPEIAPGDMARGSLTFQMMASLQSNRLAAVQKKIMASTPLYNFLRQEDIKSPDLFNDLIGTLALREGNYARAIVYLAKVSTDYQHSMNLYRNGYLGLDPFIYYPERWEKEEWGEYIWYNDMNQAAKPQKSIENAKLTFACQMLAYQQQIKSAPTADERAYARLMYALGRRNSFEQCWALTQYWRGFIEWRFLPKLDYWDSDFYEQNYEFLYDYTPEMAMKNERVFNSEIKAALQMMKSDEMRAEAEYLLNNLKTIAKKYPHTQLAERLKTSCDNWKNWL